jgi:methylmalonyl-CoA mutase
MELFKEFPPVSPQQWKEQIIKDLKGVAIEQLDWKTDNGFIVHPFYTTEDLKENPAPVFTGSSWDICGEIEVKNEKQANERALKALQLGASGLSFRVHKAIDTKLLLKDIEIENIYTQFSISNDALHLVNDLKEFAGKKNAFDGKVKTFVNLDPLLLLAHYGEWHDDAEKDLSAIKDLAHIPADLSLYLEAGANTVNELGIGLSHLNEYFNFLNEKNILKNKIIHISISVKGDFFNEIAKLRTLRKLVTLLQKQYGTDLPLHIHAQSASINKSSLDAYNNMIRTTTECMSAIIGGCDSLSVLPYNSGFEDPGDFAERMAINQQHICRDEAYLGKVADIAAGSYYVETLTEELAARGWERFREIEAKGGYITSFTTGFIQELIEKDRDELLKESADGKRVLVGINKFQNPGEKTEPYTYLVKPKAEAASPFKKIKPVRMAFKFEEEKLLSNKAVQ